MYNDKTVHSNKKPLWLIFTTISLLTGAISVAVFCLRWRCLPGGGGTPSIATLLLGVLTIEVVALSQ